MFISIINIKSSSELTFLHHQDNFWNYRSLWGIQHLIIISQIRKSVFWWLIKNIERDILKSMIAMHLSALNNRLLQFWEVSIRCNIWILRATPEANLAKFIFPCYVCFILLVMDNHELLNFRVYSKDVIWKWKQKQTENRIMECFTYRRSICRNEIDGSVIFVNSIPNKAFRFTILEQRIFNNNWEDERVLKWSFTEHFGEVSHLLLCQLFALVLR